MSAVYEILADVKSGFLFSIFYTFVFGIRWIIVGLVLIAAMSYITYSMKDRTKLVFFTTVYLITTALKLYSIYNFFYIEYGFMLPDALASPVLGLAICLLISIPCWLYGLRRYAKNLEAIPFISSSMALFKDSVLTQMIFVPFIA